MKSRRGILREDSYDWIVQGFHIREGNLELFLVPVELRLKNSPGWTPSVRALCMHGRENLTIWDFNRRTLSAWSPAEKVHFNYISVSPLDYLLALPLDDKMFVSFASIDEGCHGQVTCAGVVETEVAGRGKWISRFIPENPEEGSDGTVSRPGINENWHDCLVTGFLVEGDELQMFIVYHSPVDVKCRPDFALSGKIAFKGVTRQRISNFRQGNILLSIDVEKRGDKTLVDISSSYGCDGRITCREIEETSAMVHGEWKISFESEGR